MKSLFLGTLLLVTALPLNAAIVTREVDYKVDGTVMKGYMAYDDATKQPRPGVLVVHEWWGMNDYARKRARMLAGLGYTAFALDMYGEGKQAHHPKDAGELSGEIAKNQPMAQARFRAALELLRNDAHTDRRHIAAIGYCFGGTVVLEMARAGTDLAGVASFHGNLATTNPAKPGAIKASILVMTGADDPFVPAEQVTQFKQEMESSKTHYKLISYPGAKHSFTNPDADGYGKQFNLPLAYNKEADAASWQEMQTFFKQIFN